MRNNQGLTITNNPEEIDKFAEAFIDVLANRLSRKELCGSDYHNDKLSQNSIVKQPKEERESFISNIESSEEPILLNTKDVAKITQLGINNVYELFKRSDFPCIKIGKQYFVERNTMLEWLRNASLARKIIQI